MFNISPQSSRFLSCAMQEVAARMAAGGFTGIRPGIQKKISSLMEKKAQMMVDEANANLPFCASSFKYELISLIGQGAYGVVFKARNKQTNEDFALKMILPDNASEGFPFNAIREVKILQVLEHKNIIKLVEICCSPASDFYYPYFYLVFDFCEHDLCRLLSNKEVKFTLGEIKMVLQQLLNALYFLHASSIVHRDLKPANILMTKNGILKLADFGLSRPLRGNRKNQPNLYTNLVVTLWYRPPELLLGEQNYDSSIDLWGIGCIMAEMWTRTPILRGQSETSQLLRIIGFCGSITLETLPQAANLKLFSELKLPKNEKRKVKEILKKFVKDPNALNLIDAFLRIDPSSRKNCDDALNHEFFWTDPLPCDLEGMIKQHQESWFQYCFNVERAKRIHEDFNQHAGAYPTANEEP